MTLSPPPPNPLRRGRKALVLAGIVAFVVALPIAGVVGAALAPTDDLWAHLLRTVLAGYVVNSALLAMGVAVLTGIAGTATGWLIAMYRFPGSRLFAWALLLPLAMPAYILAFVYGDYSAYAGSLQSWLRATFGWQRGDYWFPEVSGLGGAVFVLSAALYPYVYLLARAAFAGQSATAIEASRTLGRGPWTTFTRVALPMAMPSLVAGMALCVMESLADFGAVSVLGASTFTTGIYRAWFALASPAGAAQLAIALLGGVGLAMLAARVWGGSASSGDTGQRPLATRRLRGGAAVAATLACLLPLAAGFIVPAAMLLRLVKASELPASRLLALAGNTAALGAVAAVLTVAVAIALAHQARLSGRPGVALAARLASLGYATPGAVIAIGILIVVGLADHAIDGVARMLTGSGTGLLLGGTMAALLYGLVVRFIAVGHGAVQAGYARIGPSMDAAARSLGTGPLGTMARVHLPLLRPSLVAALVLVFADVLKELPLTMILQPFNFETLAVEAFRYATTERLDDAALPSLLIVLVGLLPVWLLGRQQGGLTSSRPDP